MDTHVFDFLFVPIGGTRARPPLDASHERIRERYIAARFAGFVGPNRSLGSPERVLEAARIHLQEGELELADELLQLTIEDAPLEKALRLAQLEVAFLRRDAAHFAVLARQLHETLPHCDEWPEVEHLESVLASAAAQGSPTMTPGRGGSWVEPPGWIEAHRDIASEALASELHHAVGRAMVRGTPLSGRTVP